MIYLAANEVRDYESEHLSIRGADKKHAALLLLLLLMMMMILNLDVVQSLFVFNC